MKNITDMKDIIGVILGIIIFIVIVYGMYWIFKTGSYFFFYESMVIETVKELVKPEYLRGN